VSLRIKICGITSLADALVAVDAGADALGFIFWEKSPRYIDPADAAHITGELPPFVKTVGVFVNEDPEVIRDTVEAAGVDCVQLHGDESPDEAEKVARITGAPVIKAVRLRESGEIEAIKGYKVSALLLDTFKEGVPGGTGETFDWSLALEAKAAGRIILSGGLSPANVASAVATVRPYAVDVSTGVESAPGKKDAEKVRAFIEEARKAAS